MNWFCFTFLMFCNYYYYYGIVYMTCIFIFMIVDWCNLMLLSLLHHYYIIT